MNYEILKKKLQQVVFNIEAIPMQCYGSSEGSKEITRNKVRVALRACASISTDDITAPTIGGWAEGRNVEGLAE